MYPELMEFERIHPEQFVQDFHPGELKVKRPSKAHERERQMDAQVMPRGSGRLLQAHT